MSLCIVAVSHYLSLLLKNPRGFEDHYVRKHLMFGAVKKVKPDAATKEKIKPVTKKALIVAEAQQTCVAIHSKCKYSLLYIFSYARRKMHQLMG